MWKTGPPPAVPAPSAHAVIAALPFRIWDSSLLAPDATIYAVTTSSGGPSVVRWTNPGQPSSYSLSAAMTNAGGFFDPTDICWDSVNNCAYVAYPGSSDAIHTLLEIYKVDSSLTLTHLVNAAPILPPGVTGAGGAICTDGTHIYYLAGGAGASSLYKFRCSDGVQVATIDMTNPGGGANTPGNGCILGLMTGNGVGNLFCGGFDTAVVGRPWIAKVPTSLASITSIVNVSAMNDMGDDRVAIGDFFWIADEHSFPPVMFRAANTDLSQTSVPVSPGAQQTATGAPASGVDGIFYDGQYLWATGSSDALLTMLDPVSLTILKTFRQAQQVAPSFLVNGIQNELIIVPGRSGAFMISYQYSGLHNSNAAFVDLTSGPS